MKVRAEQNLGKQRHWPFPALQWWWGWGGTPRALRGQGWVSSPTSHRERAHGRHQHGQGTNYPTSADCTTLPLVLRHKKDGVMTREMAPAQEPPHFCSPNWQRGDHHAKSKRPNLSAQMNGAKVTELQTSKDTAVARLRIPSFS